jgi:hypothetical protein
LIAKKWNESQKVDLFLWVESIFWDKCPFKVISGHFDILLLTWKISMTENSLFWSPGVNLFMTTISHRFIGSSMLQFLSCVCLLQYKIKLLLVRPLFEAQYSLFIIIKIIHSSVFGQNQTSWFFAVFATVLLFYCSQNWNPTGMTVSRACKELVYWQKSNKVDKCFSIKVSFVWENH